MLSAITDLMTCIGPYYSAVSLLQQSLGISGVPAGVISGLLFITAQDCFGEFFGGIGGIDKGLAVL